MSEDVVVVEKDGFKEVEISSLQLVVRYDEESLEIIFKGKKNNSIMLDGNTKLCVDGDFYILVAGEMGLATNGSPIHLDSVNSKLFINSRVSKLLENLPESIEYRRKNVEEQKQGRQRIIEEHEASIGRMEKLERKVYKLQLQLLELRREVKSACRLG